MHSGLQQVRPLLGGYPPSRGGYRQHLCQDRRGGAPALQAIDKALDKGTRRVTLHLPYNKGNLLNLLYEDAKVEAVEYNETIDVVAVCNPRAIGLVKDYIEGYVEPKEDWEL